MDNDWDWLHIVGISAKAIQGIGKWEALIILYFKLKVKMALPGDHTPMPYPSAPQNILGKTRFYANEGKIVTPLNHARKQKY